MFVYIIKPTVHSVSDLFATLACAIYNLIQFEFIMILPKQTRLCLLFKIHKYLY